GAGERFENNRLHADAIAQFRRRHPHQPFPEEFVRSAQDATASADSIEPSHLQYRWSTSNDGHVRANMNVVSKRGCRGAIKTSIYGNMAAKAHQMRTTNLHIRTDENVFTAGG